MGDPPLLSRSPLHTDVSLGCPATEERSLVFCTASQQPNYNVQVRSPVTLKPIPKDTYSMR